MTRLYHQSAVQVTCDWAVSAYQHN